MPTQDPAADAERLRLERLDQSVLAEAAAAREHELALRDSDNRRLIEVERIKAAAAKARHEQRGRILAGLAVATVVLAIIAAIWTGVDRAGAKDLLRQRQHEQTAQECIRAGNIWINDGCLITRQDPGAPAPGATR
jgi:hypothetical protein